MPLDPAPLLDTIPPVQQKEPGKKQKRRLRSPHCSSSPLLRKLFPRPLRLGRDFRVVALQATRFLNRNRWACLVIFLLTLAAAVIMNPHDGALLKMIHGKKIDRDLFNLASEISHWGDFAQFNLGGAAIIWAIGYIRRSRWVQRLAVASLLAAILAGLFCNVWRFTFGRPRPDNKEKVEDRFYGFAGTFRHFHSFPSGHTSTAFGSGIPILTAVGPVAIPVAAFSASVGWSRLYKSRHYPSDVLVGAMFGTIFGVATSWHLREIRVRRRRRKR